MVVLVGTNNHGNTPEQVAEGIGALVEAIHEKQPNAHILILVLSALTLNSHSVFFIQAFCYASPCYLEEKSLIQFVIEMLRSIRFLANH